MIHIWIRCCGYIAWLTGMSHRKWSETKQQPRRGSSGHQISCCLVSLHFLCDILYNIYLPGLGTAAEWLDVPSIPSTLSGAESVLSALRAAMSAGGVGRTERRPIPAGALMAEAACGGGRRAGLDEMCLEQVRLYSVAQISLVRGSRTNVAS